MESDLLSLHWMEHSSVFSQAIGNLRTKTSYSDATLACDGNFYQVHKFVLSTCSNYFNAIFEWTPCINPVVVINNVTCKELEALLDFMYIGEVSVKESLIPDIMRAAECLRIRGLSIPKDDGMRSNLKNKSKSDLGGPARKRRRTSGNRKRVPVPVSNSVPSSNQPSESSSQITVSPPASATTHHYDEENLNHIENQALDLTPIQQPQTQPSESQNYDAGASHTPEKENNAPSTSLQMPPSPQPHLTVQPLQSLQSANTIINQHCQTSTSQLPTPSHSSVLDVSSHEHISETPVHSAVDIKSEKVELEETKPHSSQAHGTMLSEEIPALLDSLVNVRSHYDHKPEPGEETVTFHPVEPSQTLYEFNENLPSASTTPSHQEVQHQKGPTTSDSSKRIDRNSIEENPALKCSVCGKQFQKKDSFSRHLRIHDKDPYACPHCPFNTTIFRDFQIHKKTEHSATYKCPTAGCEYTTTRYDCYKRHVARHDKTHNCPECKFVTNCTQNLNKHIKNKHTKK